MRNAWKTVLKATEKHNQARNSERSDGVRGIVDTPTPRMTAQRLVNELVSVLYPCHSDVLLYRPRILNKMAKITIDMIRTNHRAAERILKMLFHLGYLTGHGTYQWILVMK